MKLPFLRLFSRLGKRQHAQGKAAPQLAAQRHSFPDLRQGSAPKGYSIELANKWTFYDGYRIASPHLVLYDAMKRPRFVLCYDRGKSGGSEVLLISYIQRHRSETLKDFGGISALVDRHQSRKLQKSIGMFPSEFLLSEFIYRHRDRIMSGIRVVFDIGPWRNTGKEKLYRPLLDRFFKRSEVKSWGESKFIEPYELSLEKRRVKEILRMG